MPRRKKGRDKAQGERRNRPKSDAFTLNTRAFTGVKTQREAKPERRPWRQERPPHQERTIEDIIGLEVMENPLKEVEKERE
ncbi:hypothetical protein LCGC14_1090600 [marine sediment metagenome]|uniref:Uncharacterized protein n=1 Tax=marine sediment metagenome TaxID=412755 RepID=A0A0F9MCI9_9ZZZZ